VSAVSDFQTAGAEQQKVLLAKSAIVVEMAPAANFSVPMQLIDLKDLSSK